MLEYVIAALLIVVAGLATKYLVPFLKTARHLRYAQWIAYIADDATDDLVKKYPNEWLKYLNHAVDRVIEVCGLQDGSEVARRAVNASASRKKVK